MNDRERESLRGCASADSRALLERAAVPVVSDQLRVEVRRVLEDRLSPRGRRRAAGRLALALAASLVTGSALAYGLTQLRTRAARQVTPAAAPRPRPPAAGIPTAGPGSERPVEPRAPSAPPVRRRVSAHTRAPAPRPSPVGAPGLDGPPGLWSAPPPGGDEDPSPPPPAPLPPRLVITREGRREVALVLAADRVVGQLRDMRVDLSITGASILGTLGDANVRLLLHGHQAEGWIGSLPVRFELAETRDGHALRDIYLASRALPIASTRVATTHGSLSWSPGCDAPLPATAAGIYEGRCASGRQARVVVPPSWQRLPPLTRMILLSFFLTERDRWLGR